jgi:hypothetical protein
LSGSPDRHRITEHLGKAAGNGTVHAARVSLGHAAAISFGLLMEVFAPHSDADG